MKEGISEGTRSKIKHLHNLGSSESRMKNAYTILRNQNMNKEFVAYILDMTRDLRDRIRAKKIEESEYWRIYKEDQDEIEYKEEREILNKIRNALIKKNPTMLSTEIIDQRILFKSVKLSVQNYMSEKEFVSETERYIMELTRFEMSRDVDIPLVFLELDTDLIEFGGVKFVKPGEEETESNWWRGIHYQIGNNAEYIAYSFARVNVSGATDIALRAGVNKVNEVLLYLRGIGFPITAKRITQVGLINEFAIAQGLPFRALNYKWNIKLEFDSNEITWIGPGLVPHNLSKLLFEEGRGPISIAVNKIISNDLNEMQSKILLGLRWIGEATKPDNNNARFVKFALALESLLADGDTGITSILAERAAFVVGENLVRREEIDGQIRRFYKMRSEIVHGNQIVVGNQELIEFGQLVREICFSLLRQLKNFETMDQFRHWVLAKRYS